MLRQLNLLRVQAAHGKVSEGHHIHPRNSVLDLVVVASTNEEAEAAGAIIAELARHHPCRAIIVQDEPHGAPARIDAAVTSRSHTLVGGAVCQYEEIFLRVCGPAGEQIPSLVEPMLAPDVDTYVWWTGSPPIRSDRFRQSLQMASVVIVDSGAFARPRSMLVELAEAAALRHPRPVFADYQWARLHGWREVTAQFFNPRERRPLLAAVERLTISYACGEPDITTGPILLTAWLAALLNWEVVEPEQGAGRSLLRAGGHDVEVLFEGRRSPLNPSGSLLGIRLEAAGPGGPSRVDARREEDHLVVSGEVAGRPLARRVVPQEAPSAGALLSHLLMDARGDGVFPQVLRAARELAGGSG